jgi:hypothetical protein
MWDFLQKFVQAFYRNTIGGLMRLIEHTQQGQVDEIDKQYVGRLALYLTLGIVSLFFFEYVAVLLALRIMVYSDVFATFGNIFKDTANAYA